MSIIACKECNKEISSAAKVCPHCGVKLKASVFVKIILWVFGGFVAIIIFGASVGRSPAAIEQSLCKEQMQLFLKSPSTAEFSNVKHEGSLVVGSVDAQNGFGATVRNEFSCKVEMDAANKPYVANVCIDGKSISGKDSCY